jgi:hypothetical protein
MASLNTAKTAALSYALLVLLVGLQLLTGTLSQGDASWQRIVGHTGIAIIAPLPPLATLWLGRKFARGETAERTLASGVLMTVAVPVIIGLLVLASSEPLAMLFMFYTPAIQLVIGLLTLAMVWGAGRTRRE